MNTVKRKFITTAGIIIAFIAAWGLSRLYWSFKWGKLAPLESGLFEDVSSKESVPAPDTYLPVDGTPPFITVAEFIEEVNRSEAANKRLVVVDVRSEHDYREAHFPGAAWAGGSWFRRISPDASGSSVLEVQPEMRATRAEDFPLVKEIKQKESGGGKSAGEGNLRVVVAGYSTDLYACASAFRLSNLGISGGAGPAVSVLDGGCTALSQAGVKLTGENPRRLVFPNKGWNQRRFAVNAARFGDRLVKSETAGEELLLDVRIIEEYRGTAGRNYPRAGRIPGSRWMGVRELVDPVTGGILPRDMVLEAFEAWGVPYGGKISSVELSDGSGSNEKGKTLKIIGSGDGDGWMAAWFFRAAGIDDFQVLQGGFRLYSADRSHPVVKP